MKFPEFLKTPVAVHKTNVFDMSCHHLTTLDFGTFRPVYYHNMIPGEKLSVDASCFARLSPLVFPVLGDVSIETRAFFVPFRLLSESWQDFISNKVVFTDSSGTTSTPTICKIGNPELVAMFLNHTSGSSVQLLSSGTDTNYDIYVDANYYKFTST